jgi:hypothetical protein
MQKEYVEFLRRNINFANTIKMIYLENGGPGS